MSWLKKPPIAEEPPIQTYGDLLEFMKHFQALLQNLPLKDQEEGKRLLAEMGHDFIEGVRGTRRLTESSLRIESLTRVLIVLTAVLSILTAFLVYRTFLT
jgi:hypothetical protein